MTQENSVSTSEVTIQIGRQAAAEMPSDILASLRKAAEALEGSISGPTASMVCREVLITECAVFMACKGFHE
jgi:hypothetical protein